MIYQNTTHHTSLSNRIYFGFYHEFNGNTRRYFLYCSYSTTQKSKGNWLTKVDKVVTEIGFEGYFIEQWAYR